MFAKLKSSVNSQNLIYTIFCESTEASVLKCFIFASYILKVLPACLYNSKYVCAITIIRTVSTFSSCSKCVGSLCIIHDRTLDCHPVFWSWICMDGLMTELSFDSQATWSNDVFGLNS